MIFNDMLTFFDLLISIKKSILFRPLLKWGDYILKWVFFVQRILTLLPKFRWFYSKFLEFLKEKLPILLKFVDIFQENVADFVYKDKNYLRLFLFNFLPKIVAK